MIMWYRHMERIKIEVESINDLAHLNFTFIPNQISSNLSC